MPDVPDEASLNRLVLTSGDFGLAYLTERWAARFVTELFRNYVVCFVGYSINDPVLRYMMDALAADRMLGEKMPQAYAFADAKAGKKEEADAEWYAKGVIPIPYEVSSKTSKHEALHHTLKIWSGVYRDGVQGRERIVIDYAMSKPIGSTKEDDYVGRILWAMSHSSGIPAQRFAEFDPAPPLDWLDVFSAPRFKHNDLSRFGVGTYGDADDKLSFSLINRPASYTRAPWMSLVAAPSQCSLDNVMHQIARWLVRHLNDPKLIYWVAQQGGNIEPVFAQMIEERLRDLRKMEMESRHDAIEQIRRNSPNAIPTSMTHTIWRLLLTGRVSTSRRDMEFFRWRTRFEVDGFTESLRINLRELLSPKIFLKPRYTFVMDGAEDAEDAEADRFRSPLNFEVTLTARDVSSFLPDLRNTQKFQSILPRIFTDLQQLLQDALNLMAELGDADERNDPAHWDMPSISQHWQNRGFREWVLLVELLRDSWIATCEIDVQTAASFARNWYGNPFPTFLRLALFAATHDGIDSKGEWVDRIVADDGWWLWSVQTQREVLRLLVTRGVKVPAQKKRRLEKAILLGPPRKMYRDDIEEDQWRVVVQHCTWLRLAKLAAGGVSLGHAAAAELQALSRDHPDWSLAPDQRDEFSHWLSGPGDPGHVNQRQVVRLPRGRRDLVNELRSPKEADSFQDDDWRELCAESFPTVVSALCQLSRDGVWPGDRWRNAFQVWSTTDEMVKRSWRYLGSVVQRMPSSTLLELQHAVAWWLESVSKVIDGSDGLFVPMCSRLLGLKLDYHFHDSSVTNAAINHPVGLVTSGLMRFWFLSNPKDGERLPEDIKEIFTSICDNNVEYYRPGRLLLATNLVALFRVDEPWTRGNLLPNFIWERSNEEAIGVWSGYLWAPRLYRPLLEAFRLEFLKAADHFDELGDVRMQYVSILTYAALDRQDTFTTEELRHAIGSLPSEGLGASIQALKVGLVGAGDRRDEYWENRIRPYWHEIWPKLNRLKSNRISRELVQLLIETRRKFPSALSMVIDWLEVDNFPEYAVQKLDLSGHCTEHPRESLTLLDRIVGPGAWPPSALRQCLDSIRTAFPAAPGLPAFDRLDQLAGRSAGR